MIRSKRFLSLFLAATLVLTGTVPSYASDNTSAEAPYEYVKEQDVSESESTEPVFFDVTESDEIVEETPTEEENIPENEEEKYKTVSDNDETHKEEKGATTEYTLSVNEADYIYQFGGLDAVDMTEYIEILEEGDDENRFYGSEDMPKEDTDGAVAAVTEGIENWVESIDLSDYNIYYDGSEEAERHLVGIVSNAVNYHGGFICYEGIKSFEVNENGTVSSINVEYADPQKATDYNSALKAAYNEAIPDKSIPTIAKIMALHDWLVQHVVYGYGTNQYTAYGAIVDRKCVCMGYSLAFGDLLGLAGIEKGYVTSTSLNHMWNVVKVDGKWYNVDCTWDDPLSYELGDDRYWHFLKSTSVFKNYPKKILGGNHNASDWNISVGTYTYYGNSNISCSSTTYDRAWWNEACSAIVYVDGYYYYVQNDGTYFKNSLVKRSSNGTVTPVVDLSSASWGGSGKYIDMYGSSLQSAKTAGNYSVLSYCGGYIFYSTSDSVYKLDTETGKSKKLYTASSGYIWTMLACGSRVKMLVGDSKNSSSTKTVDIATVSEFNISSTYTSTTYGATAKSTLTASYKCAKDVDSENWYAYDPETETYGESIATGKTYTFDPEGKNAGTYKYRFVVVVEDETFRKDITITVNKAAVSIANNDYTLTKTYDSEALSVPRTVNFTTNASELSFEWYKTSSCKSSGKIAEEPFMAGTYYLKASFEGDTNIKPGSKVFAVSIKKCALSVAVHNQDLLYGQKPSAVVGENIDFNGVAAGDNVANFVLTPNTTELTTSGTISVGSIKICRGTEDVTSSYTISAVKGRLTVSKVPITITAENQGITYGQDISREADAYVVSGADFDASQFVVAYVNVTPSTLSATDTGTVNVSGARIYRKGTTTEVTKYFDITYVPGVLGVAKKELPGLVEENVFVDFKGNLNVEVNVYDKFKLPQDAGSVVINLNTTALDSEFTSEFDETTGILSVTRDENSQTTPCNQQYIFTVTFESDNYTNVTYRLSIVTRKTITVTLDGNGGLINGEESLEISAFDGTSIPKEYTPKSAWRFFTGWYNADGAQVLAITEANTSLVAHWETKYTVENVTSNIEDGETVAEGTKLFLYTETNGAKIYYSTDGSVPDVTDNNLYSDGIQINIDTTVKAVAVKDNCNDSGVTEINVIVAAPVCEYEGDEALFEEGKLWVAGVDTEVTFTGSAITQPNLRVYFDKKKLVQGTDYTVSYSNNTKPGTASIIIKGKGNYSGTVSKTFAIVNPDNFVSITGAKISGVSKAYSYTGETITPSVTVKVGSKTLVRDVDYTVVYENNVNSGTAQIKITGTENTANASAYVGTKVVTFKIAGTKDMKYASIVYNDLPADKSYDCTGSAVVPDFSIEYKGTVLTSDDYTYTITNNILPGKITIKVTGKNAYKNSKTFKVNLAAISISKAAISGISSPEVYMGYAVTQDAAVVKLGETTLVKDVDYTVSYKSNAKPGTATVIFTGINCYTGSVKKTYKITKYNLLTGGENLVIDYDKTVTYKKGGAKPAVTVTLNGVLLNPGKDYTVSYANNKAVGSRTKLPTITIKGRGGFTGNVTKRFSIVKSDISNLSLTLGDRAYSSKAGGYKAKPVIKDSDGKTLGGSDYTNVSYTYAEDFEYTLKDGSVAYCYEGDEIPSKEVAPVGAKIKVSVEGKGNYYGTISTEYRIIAKSISSAKVSVKKQTYTGSKLEPGKSDITVKIGSTVLTSADYEIVGYERNETKGYGYVTIRGIGKFSGTKKVKFIIQYCRLK